MKVIVKEDVNREVQIDDNGSISIMIGQNPISLTSKYNIEKEEERFLDLLDELWVNQIIVVFGIGIGSWIKNEKIQTLIQHNKFIIIEPSRKVFDYAKGIIGNVELEDMVVYVGIDLKAIPTLLQQAGGNANNVRTVCYGNYGNIYSELYKNMYTNVRDYIRNFKINQNTIKIFTKIFTTNILKNTFGNSTYNNINDFKNRFKGVPALLISAGPSLEKQKDKIKDFNGIIFSGGRTLKSLIDIGVKPDFLVSVDPQLNAYYLIEEVLDVDVPLITFIESNSNIVEEYNGPKVLMNSFNVSRNDKYLDQDIDCIKTGGSVANTTLSICNYMGCNPIVFIGQDLAYTEGKHHADTTVNKKFDKDIVINTEKRQVMVDGYYDKPVISNAAFVSFLSWFENVIKTLDKTVINCTEGGAKIKGTSQMSFRDYLESEYNHRVKKSEIDIPLGENSFSFSRDHADNLNDLTQSIVDILEDSKESAKKLGREYKKHNKDMKRVNKLINKLDENDEAIMEVAEQNFLINYFVQDVLNDFNMSVKNRDVDKENLLIEVAKSNQAFYDDFYDGAVDLIEEIKEIVGEKNVK